MKQIKRSRASIYFLSWSGVVIVILLSYFLLSELAVWLGQFK